LARQELRQIGQFIARDSLAPPTDGSKPWPQWPSKLPHYRSLADACPNMDATMYER
jgi:hypothetical protein